MWRPASLHVKRRFTWPAPPRRPAPSSSSRASSQLRNQPRGRFSACRPASLLSPSAHVPGQHHHVQRPPPPAAGPAAALSSDNPSSLHVDLQQLTAQKVTQVPCMWRPASLHVKRRFTWPAPPRRPAPSSSRASSQLSQPKILCISTCKATSGKRSDLASSQKTTQGSLHVDLHLYISTCAWPAPPRRPAPSSCAVSSSQLRNQREVLCM